MSVQSWFNRIWYERQAPPWWLVPLSLTYGAVSGSRRFLYARQWCSAPEDVVQEAFVKIAALTAPPDQPTAWLYRVVRNAALTAARAEARRRKHETAASHPEAWFASPEGRLDALAASEALSALAGEVREPVVAHLWGGLTFVQIGELMGISAATAHRRYLEGLAELRRRLRVECPNSSTPS